MTETVFRVPALVLRYQGNQWFEVESSKMTDKRPLDSLQVFCGASSHNVAEVYCALAPELVNRAVLRGSIRGPMSRLTHTLPATVDLEFLGAEPSPLARATVVDPCFWAPGKPYLYDVDLELVADGRVVDGVRQSVGLRTAGVIEQTMRLSFQPWFMRGVQAASDLSLDPTRWREKNLTQVWADVTEETCRQTSEEGVPVVLSLSGDPSRLHAVLQQFARWPSVVMAVVDGFDSFDREIRNAAPNLLLAQRLAAGSRFELAAWAHVGVCDANLVGSLPQVRDVGFPLILARSSESFDDLTDAASAIDDWQREADPRQRFTGIIV